MTPTSLSLQHGPSSDCAASRPWFSASGGRPKPCQRFDLVPGVSSLVDLRRQFFVRNSLPDYRSHKTVQPLQRVTTDLASIQPEGELVHIAGEVFLTDLVIDSVKPALQDRPHALYPVGTGHPVYVLIRRVIHALLPKEQPVQIVVGCVLIGKEKGADFYVGVNGRLNLFDAGALDRHGLRASASFAHSDYSGFANGATPLIQLFVFVLVGFQTADKRLVNLDFSIQLVGRCAARFAESLKHEPCRLLCDPDFFCQLHRRDTLAGRNEQVHGIDPLVERDVRAFKDRGRADRELDFTGVAKVVTFARHFARRDPRTAIARRADWAIDPQAKLQVVAGGFLVR